MIDTEQIDYSLLDRPEILMSLFHPRPEWGESEIYKDAADILIPVEGDILIGARFHMAAETDPNILFFTGMVRLLPIMIKWAHCTTRWL